jgi:hypothetical protein
MARTPVLLEANLISDLVHKIENLKEPDAIARLLELEDAHEKTYFEIGGVLSVIQRGKWFGPFASLDEWVEKNTAMKRSKARALIQIYNAIVDSGITWGRSASIGERRVPADDEGTPDPGEVGRQALRHPVDEIILFRVP